MKDLLGEEAKQKRRTKTADLEAEAIWTEYPTGYKRGKDKGLRAIKSAIKRGEITADELLQRTQFFAYQCEANRGSRRWTARPPDGGTWYNQRRWHDEAFVAEFEQSKGMRSAEEINQRFVSAARYWTQVWQEDATIQREVADLRPEQIWARRAQLAKRSPTLRAILGAT